MVHHGYRKVLSSFFVAMAVFFSAICLASFPVGAQDADIPVAAPLNPAFVDYLNRISPLHAANFTADRYALGYIPSPIDRSHMAGQSIFSIQPLDAIPASYDLRTHGRVTPVKNQLSCGDCWAFASMGSLESDILSSALETWNFSEYNLNMNHGFDNLPCHGGGGDMSTAYFARWGMPLWSSGPLNESDDPYPGSFLSNGDPFPGYAPPAGALPQKHLQNTIVLPFRTGPLDNTNIKQAVIDYGAVYTTYYASATYYSRPCPITAFTPSGTCTTYYYTGAGHNHAVDIVGWDDNFPASSFSPSTPPGNGAFIIKNSWGTGWGVNNGYFYISYYDTTLGYDDNFVFNGAQPVTNYSRVYQYDALGATGYLSWGGGKTGWFANIFTAAATEDLTAVSFHTNDVNVAYTVYVYTNVSAGSPRSGVLADTVSGTFAAAGYHTVSLSAPVTVTAGQGFSVVVRVTNPTYLYPIPMEYPWAGYSTAATASAGQSYISTNGSSWSDITSVYNLNTNVCIKAFTASDITAPSAPVSLSSTPATWSKLNSFAIDWTNPADPSGIAGAYYKIGSVPTTDTDGTYTASKPFTVQATAAGGQVIYVWLKDGAGNTSYLNRSSTTLNYDGTVPADGTLSPSAADSQVSLDWSGFSDSGGSGLSGTYLVVRSASSYPGSQCTDGTQVYLGSMLSTSDTGLTNGTPYYYRACAYDVAGNISAGATATATPVSCGSNPAQIYRSGVPFGATHATLQLAYAAATAEDDDVRLQGTLLTGPFDFLNSNTVTLTGGCDCSYHAGGYYAILNGLVRILGAAGAVTIENIIIM